MRDSEQTRRAFGDVILRFVILALAALLLMALQISGQLTAVQSFVTQITSPAQLGATGVSKSVADAVAFFSELRTLRQRNSELEQLVGSLLAENATLREVERENTQLREVLNFGETRPGLELRGAQIVARVIGQESNNFLDFMMLDLGMRHGIEVGMPVVSNQGFVGRISEVTESTSKVLLLTDPNSSVNALLQSSRLNGVIRGEPGGNLAVGGLIMDYLPQGAGFGIGEIVLTSMDADGTKDGYDLTSGIGGNFPKGIPIGQVVESRERDVDVFKQAVVRPAVDFSSLELVLIVTNFDPLEDLPQSLAPGSEPVIEELPAQAPGVEADGDSSPVAP